MRVCHGFTAEFDEPNLVSSAGLAPVLLLAERAGFQDLVGEHVQIAKPGGVNAQLKIPALVAGMIVGADSIDDMALLRHGAMSRLFGGVRAPSTLGTFLRTFSFGHVRQLDAVASRLLINLTRHAPLLPGVWELAYVDIDDTVRATAAILIASAASCAFGCSEVGAANSRRENRSSTVATYTLPSSVGISVVSPHHLTFAAGAVKSRLSRSGNFGANLS